MVSSKGFSNVKKRPSAFLRGKKSPEKEKAFIISYLFFSSIQESDYTLNLL